MEALYGDVSGFTIVHNAHDTLYECDFAFICSGTATLEAVLIGTPFILSYIAGRMDYFIGTKLLKIDLTYIGLGNIMFDKFQHRAMHPELWQNEVTLENLLRAYREMDREKFFDDALQLRGYLGHGSSRRVAQIIEEKNDH